MTDYSDNEKYGTKKISEQNFWKRDTISSRSRLTGDFKKPALNKSKELLDMVNHICKSLHLREIKTLK